MSKSIFLSIFGIALLNKYLNGNLDICIAYLTDKTRQGTVVFPLFILAKFEKDSISLKKVNHEKYIQICEIIESGQLTFPTPQQWEKLEERVAEILKQKSQAPTKSMDFICSCKYINKITVDQSIIDKREDITYSCGGCKKKHIIKDIIKQRTERDFDAAKTLCFLSKSVFLGKNTAQKSSKRKKGHVKSSSS